MKMMRECATLIAASLLLSATVIGQNPAPPANPPAGTFQFAEGRSDMLQVPLVESEGALELTWPQTGKPDWDTALLSVTVSSDAAAHLPFVEIVSGSLSARQYVRAGDNGLRWVNLSFLRGAISPGGRVTLRPESAGLTAGAATLRLFSSHPDLSKTILVVAPHPDDAEIASFALYSHRQSTVVTVTSGNAGSATYDSVFGDIPQLYEFKGHIRVIDSITVPWQGGIPPERAFNLGYFDARLPDMYAKPDQVIPEMYSANTDIGVYRRDNLGSLLPKGPRASMWNNLVDDMETLLKKVKPAVILAPHPQLDLHRDHQLVTVALAQALARWKKPVTLLLYTNHADGNRYPYGPAGSVMSLPPPVARDVTFDRVYSHPVSPELQRLKLFALESMHDLRYTPTRQYQLAVNDERAAAPEKPGPAPDITYLRRGPRANELFFVYDQDSVKPVIAQYLADRR
jgi:LmbE family N-acetylglucosaminyl deacetylase